MLEDELLEELEEVELEEELLLEDELLLDDKLLDELDELLEEPPPLVVSLHAAMSRPSPRISAIRCSIS